MNQIGIIKTHLNLRRVYIHVDIFVRDLNKQKDNLESVRLQSPAVGLYNCVRDKFVTDKPAV